VLRGVQVDANKVGTPAFPPRQSRILGRKFRRSVDTLPPLHAADGTSSEHGASLSPGVSGTWSLLFQEPFVCVAGASDLI
jgi:hypothetical protein